MSDVREPSTRSFRPGEWFGIFGEHATVILPPSEKARVAGLWEMVDAGAGFDETLDALIATGLRDLPGFVLVSEAEGETRVVLRGAARASFTTADETVDVDGSVATTWVERSLRGVTRMSVEVAEESGSSDLSITGGLVRLSRVDQPPRTADAEPEAAEPLATEPVVAGAAFDGPTVDEPTVDEPVVDEPPEPEPGFDGETTQAVPFLGGELLDAEHAGEEPVEEQVDEDGYDEDGYDEPPIWVPTPPAPPVAPPTTPPPPPPPVAAPTPPPPPPPVAGDGDVDEDQDGMTRAGDWDPGQFARQQPGIPGQPPAPSVTARPVARLLFSSGETVEVDRAVLVGRAPEARRFTSTEQPRLVTVPSPNQEISSTHLEIRPGSGADHGSAVVTDLGSTNGTVVVQPGLPPEDLQPGIVVQLIPGAVVDLGEGVTIQVTNP